MATYPFFETTLDGSKSTGKPNKPILSYAWRVISKPQASTSTLSNTEIAKPVLTPDVEGEYVFGLKVSDGTETSEEKTVSLKVKPLGDTTDFVSANVTAINKSFPTDYDYSDYIALSDGWVVAKNASQNKVVFINGITGNKGKEFAISSTPDRLAIDFEQNLIFASLLNVGKIAKININTGEVTYISINGPARDIEMGENGVLFVGCTDLHVIDIEQNKIVSTLTNSYGSAIGMAYDKVGNNLIVPYSSSYSYSYRYTFDESDFTLRLAQTMYSDSSKYRKNPKVSEDGKHLMYQYYGSALYDYDCNDISISKGQYNTINACYDACFTLDSATLATDNGSSIMLFDTVNHFNIATISKYNTSNYSNGISFSRGGKFIYNYDSSYKNISIYPSGITQTPVEPVLPKTQPIALISGSNSFVGFTNDLDANNSRMSGGDALTYTWSLVSKPEGSSVSLSTTDQKALSFVSDVEGEYKFSLVVNNGKTSSETAYKTIKCKKIDSSVDDIDMAKVNSNITLKYTFKGSIPLCDGWIITANSTNCAVITNTLTGAVLKSYQLTNAPASMALDFDTGTLLVAMSSSSKLAKVNIYDGATTYIDMPSNCSIVVKADKNKAFVKNANGVSIVDYAQNKVLTTASVSGSMIVFDKVNNFLFTAESGGSTLYKYIYNPDTNTMTSSQSSSSLGSNGLDLRVSPDGKHLVFCVGSGNGNGYTIFDVDPQNITKSNGQWNTDAYPTSGYFTMDSKYFIGSNGETIKLFDVENHFLVGTISFSRRTNYEKVYFSRGSKLIYYFDGSIGYVYKNPQIQ